MELHDTRTRNRQALTGSEAFMVHFLNMLYAYDIDLGLWTDTNGFLFAIN